MRNFLHNGLLPLLFGSGSAGVFALAVFAPLGLARLLFALAGVLLLAGFVAILHPAFAGRVPRPELLPWEEDHA